MTRGFRTFREYLVNILTAYKSGIIDLTIYHQYDLL